MDDEPQAPKKSFQEWLLQLSDDDFQVVMWWIDRKFDNPDQPWDGAKRTHKLLGGMEWPYRR